MRQRKTAEGNGKQGRTIVLRNKCFEVTVKLVSFCHVSTTAVLFFLVFLLPLSISLRRFLSELCCGPHLKKRKTDHITPLFQSLHWLPVPQRIQYKIKSPCYECTTRTAPSYFCDCLQFYTPSRTLRYLCILCALLLSSDTLSLQIPLRGLSAVSSPFHLRLFYMK